MSNMDTNFDLQEYLTKGVEADPDWAKKPDIKWNFTKFIIDREGNVVARFEPTADMAEVEACVKALLLRAELQQRKNG